MASFGKKIILGDKSMKNCETIAKIMTDAEFDVEPFEMELSSRVLPSSRLAARQQAIIMDLYSQINKEDIVSIRPVLIFLILH